MYSKYCRYINYYGKDILKAKKAKKQKEFIQCCSFIFNDCGFFKS